MAEYKYRNIWTNVETNNLDHTAFLTGAWQLAKPSDPLNRAPAADPAATKNDPTKTTPTREPEVETSVSGGVSYSNNRAGRSRRAKRGMASAELLGAEYGVY